MRILAILLVMLSVSPLFAQPSGPLADLSLACTEPTGHDPSLTLVCDGATFHIEVFETVPALPESSLKIVQEALLASSYDVDPALFNGISVLPRDWSIVSQYEEWLMFELPGDNENFCQLSSTSPQVPFEMVIWFDQPTGPERLLYRCFVQAPRSNLTIDLYVTRDVFNPSRDYSILLGLLSVHQH